MVSYLVVCALAACNPEYFHEAMTNIILRDRLARLQTLRWHAAILQRIADLIGPP